MLKNGPKTMNKIFFLFLILSFFNYQLFSMEVEQEDNDLRFEQYKAAFELRDTILNETIFKPQERFSPGIMSGSLILAGIKALNKIITFSLTSSITDCISSFFQYNLFPFVLYDSMTNILNYKNIEKNQQEYPLIRYFSYASCFTYHDVIKHDLTNAIGMKNDSCFLFINCYSEKYSKQQWLKNFFFQCIGGPKKDLDLDDYMNTHIRHMTRKIEFPQGKIENLLRGEENDLAPSYVFDDKAITLDEHINIIKKDAERRNHFGKTFHRDFFIEYKNKSISLNALVKNEINALQISPNGQDIIYITEESVHHVPISCFQDYTSKELLIERVKYKTKKTILITLKIILFFWYTFFYLKNICGIDFKKIRDNYKARQKIIEYLHGKAIFDLLFNLKQKKFLLNNYPLISLIPVYRIFMK